MKLEEYFEKFRENALNVEMDCPVGCADCCLNYEKKMLWEEGEEARAFLEGKGVDTSDFEDYEIEDKTNIKCDYFQLACSIDPAKPGICRRYSICEIKEDKKFIISKGYNYRKLELNNIMSYLKQNNITLRELKVGDMEKISKKIIRMTKKLAEHLRQDKR